MVCFVVLCWCYKVLGSCLVVCAFVPRTRRRLLSFFTVSTYADVLAKVILPRRELVFFFFVHFLFVYLLALMI